MLRKLIRHIRLMLAGPALFEAANQYAGLSDWLDKYARDGSGLCAEHSVVFAEEVASCAEARDEARQQIRSIIGRCAA